MSRWRARSPSFELVTSVGVAGPLQNVSFRNIFREKSDLSPFVCFPLRFRASLQSRQRRFMISPDERFVSTCEWSLYSDNRLAAFACCSAYDARSLAPGLPGSALRNLFRPATTRYPCPVCRPARLADTRRVVVANRETRKRPTERFPVQNSPSAAARVIPLSE
jgi:hypothetical protein